MTFQIYRLCRDKETIDRIKNEGNKYSLPSSILKTGIDLFTFVNEIIRTCKTDFALVCHDDIVLPEIIATNLENCIESANSYIGSDNWGVVGNAGVEYLSKNVHTLLYDPHTKYLPPKYKNPIIAETLDGNTLLLNIKNLREKNVSLPKEIKGFHLYDLILCAESYKKGLVCLISPWLYVIHSSGGDFNTFKEAMNDEGIQNYFRKNFSNHTITSINDNIPVYQNYSWLSSRKEKKTSFEELIDQTIQNLFKDKVCELNILTRIHIESPKVIRLLHSIETLVQNSHPKTKINIILSINNITEKSIGPFIQKIKKEFSTLNILEIYLNSKDYRYPRVSSLANAVDFSFSKNNNSYSWIIDYDDFVLPNIGKYLPYFLYKSEIIIGDTLVFEEKWANFSETPINSIVKDRYHSDLANRIITGSNFLPVCSVIYRTDILNNVFKNSKLKGDYYEDYAISLLTIPHFDNISTKICLAGVSHHGRNTVLEKDRTHWNYSYATFLSEIINKGVLDKSMYQYLLNNINTSSEFEGFKKGRIWKGLMFYRRLKSKLKDIFK